LHASEKLLNWPARRHPGEITWTATGATGTHTCTIRCAGRLDASELLLNAFTGSTLELTSEQPIKAAEGRWWRILDDIQALAAPCAGSLVQQEAPARPERQCR